MLETVHGIILEEICGSDIQQCRDLCNALMQHQYEKAAIGKEAIAHMRFETRMLPSYDKARDKFVLVAKDAGTPIGYVYASIEWAESSPMGVPKENVPDALRNVVPSDITIHGFFPAWMQPQFVGRVNNLFMMEPYRNTGVGRKLIQRALDWLRNQNDICHVFVHVTNGNESVIPFYESYGFEYSHDVYGGFITAYHMEKKHLKSQSKVDV